MPGYEASKMYLCDVGPDCEQEVEYFYKWSYRPTRAFLQPTS